MKVMWEKYEITREIKKMKTIVFGKCFNTKGSNFPL